MSKHWIKSNSVLIVVDLPGYQESDRRGLAFIGLNDSFGFSVSMPRNSNVQLGSQKLAVDDVSTAPDVEFDLSFIPTRKFDNENVLGLNFNFNSSYTSILQGKSETSFNVYLFVSDKQSYDFIQQIRTSQSLNGVECFAVGNCYLTQYGLSLRVSDLTRATASFVGSNIEMSVVSSDKVKVPAINFSTGESQEYYLSLDWPQISVALDEITAAQMPILPTTEIKFQEFGENLQIPSAVFSPLRDAKIQSLDIGLSIDREASYGFGSNFPYGRKIKYPVQGQLNFTTVVSNFNTGNLLPVMSGEQTYDTVINFYDPQEVFLSGKSFAELSGFYSTGVSGATGFFTESRSIKLEGAKLNSYSQSVPINNLMTAEASLSFQCWESGGAVARFGILSEGAEPPYFYTPESRKLYDASGDVLTSDSYLYIYGEDNRRHFLIDGSGHLLLADNWAAQDNVSPYPAIFPSPNPNVTSLTYVTGVYVQVQWVESSPISQYILQISEDGSTYTTVADSLFEPLYFDTSYSVGGESYYFYRVIAEYDGNFATGSSQSIYIP